MGNPERDREISKSVASHWVITHVALRFVLFLVTFKVPLLWIFENDLCVTQLLLK